MKWERIEGAWLHYKSSFKRQWSRLTNMNVMAGKRDQLSGKIQEAYGITQLETEKQISDWQDRQKEIDRPA